MRLPETLRRIYAMRNGGYVGHLVAPRVTGPRPVFDDWRGAFAPDYSSLRSVERLETVASSYADLDTDPEDVPPDAARLVILQARYGDMTLLDYTMSKSDPAVLLVDYDSGDDPVDMRFADFDTFLAALRRDRVRESYVYPPGRSLAETPEETWPKLFWDTEAPNVYRNIAEWHKGDQLPAQRADEAMLAATEQRFARASAGDPACAAGGAEWRRRGCRLAGDGRYPTSSDRAGRADRVLGRLCRAFRADRLPARGAAVGGGDRGGRSIGRHRCRGRWRIAARLPQWRTTQSRRRPRFGGSAGRPTGRSRLIHIAVATAAASDVMRDVAPPWTTNSSRCGHGHARQGEAAGEASDNFGLTTTGLPGS